MQATDPDNEAATAGLASVYADHGDARGASTLLEKLTKKNPSAKAYATLANSYEAMKEYSLAADAYKKALDEINNLNKQLDSSALSADAKTKLAKDRDDKIANIKNMEREINEFRQTRERQLQEQALRMREGIVKEITDVVMDKVKTNNLDFVFDKSGMSLNGVPLLMYSKDNVDFTNDIITVLNKPGRATTTTEKPATSAAPVANPPAKPAASPKP